MFHPIQDSKGKQGSINERLASNHWEFINTAVNFSFLLFYEAVQKFCRPLGLFWNRLLQ
jgi:hypothetical protein